MTFWYKRVNTEAVFKVMRDLEEQSSKAGDLYQKLAPRFGEIAVGGGHFDAFVEQESIRLFLSALLNGKTPDEAREEALKGTKLAVTKWNDSHCRDYVVQRPLCLRDKHIDFMYERIIKAGSVPLPTE